ncbi:prepilin-type N-terminal cleavage/methylation domain-containing protein [Candidatus Saccharibacteria bacterium]|nr:prepilin-type N-terminal cleavage/methylation domain-containing protein [Candidatus Saccharibacteria bacterium]
MKINQKGFSIVEVLLVVLVLAVLGFGGYYVWDKQSDKNEESKTSTTTLVTKNEESKVVPVEEDMTKDWTVYSGTTFSVKIPDGWELVGNREYKNIVAYCSDSSCLTYKKGVLGVVRDTEGGRGGPFRFTLFDNASPSLRGSKESYVATANYPVEKYKFTQTGEQELMDIPKGGIQYSYVIKRQSTQIVVTYSLFSPDQKDESNIVDLLVASIK